VNFSAKHKIKCFFVIYFELNFYFDDNNDMARVVLEPRLQFTASGELATGPRAAFHNIPEQPILTQEQ
jgi:hypothetical protein